MDDQVYQVFCLSYIQKIILALPLAVEAKEIVRRTPLPALPARTTSSTSGHTTRYYLGIALLLLLDTIEFTEHRFELPLGGFLAGSQCTASQHVQVQLGAGAREQ